MKSDRPNRSDRIGTGVAEVAKPLECARIPPLSLVGGDLLRTATSLNQERRNTLALQGSARFVGRNLVLWPLRVCALNSSVKIAKPRAPWRSMVRLFVLSLAALVSLTSCDRSPATKPRASEPSPPGTNQQVFQVKGVIKELKTDGKTVDIRHEEIPNYMPAMTMPFEAKDPKELTGLKAGDAV